MKKCFECGTEMPDDAIICPKCGAPQSASKITLPLNSTTTTPTNQDVWNTPVFALLPFIAALLFVIGALIFLITAFVEWEFIFAGIILFIASIANLISTLPKFIKQISNK